MSQIDDAINKYADRDRLCPMCGSDDVDFGTNQSALAGASTSVLCNSCRYTESGGDADALYLRWTTPCVHR